MTTTKFLALFLLAVALLIAYGPAIVQAVAL
jgi:hypothetical protein